MNDQVRDRIFRFLDSNGDKKISRTELSRIILFAPELKERPDRIDNLFELIDLDEDLFLNHSEFDASAKIAG
jgi:Ca2+-binding EF-hand superfamily protein